MKTYKSKISYGLLLFIFILFFGIILSMLFTNEEIEGVFVTSGILLLTLAFIFYIFFSIKYSIDNGVIKIRCGVIFKKDLSINKIKTISKTSSLISSPAASFDRIELKYDKFNSVIISPESQRDFVDELIAINPNIVNEIKNN